MRHKQKGAASSWVRLVYVKTSRPIKSRPLVAGMDNISPRANQDRAMELYHNNLASLAPVEVQSFSVAQYALNVLRTQFIKLRICT